MSKEKNIVPKLRFPEFEEEWLVAKLGDYYKNLSTGMTPSRSKPEYFGGNIPWITSGELNYNIVRETKEYISEKAVKDTKLKVYPPGTLFIAITGLEAPGTRGKCAINGIEATTNQSCMAFRENATFDTMFLFYWYRNFSEYLYRYSQGTKQQSFNNSIVDKFEIIHPSKEEQQKIADCLSSLDALIAAHRDKLDALREHKKGLMQNLFPQEGETVPKVRFPEFESTGTWEEKKISELGELINGLTYKPKDVRNEGLLVLRSSNIRNGLIDLKDCVFVRTDIKGVNLSEPDDILICVRNGSKRLIGKNALIPEEMPLSTHGAFMTVYRAKFPKFIFQLFQTEGYNRQVKADLGATINSINSKNFLKYKFRIPEDRAEQQKIADCLSAVDQLMAAQEDRIAQLQEHKRGLMQGLFPKTNG